jgi:hypothetical protein
MMHSLGGMVARLNKLPGGKVPTVATQILAFALLKYTCNRDVE